MTLKLDLPSAEDLVTDLAEALARALPKSSSGSRGREEALAAGRAVARGDGLPEEFSRRLDDSPACTLVSFDADQIQSWVFSSERVQVAAGASKVLDDLNRDVREAKLIEELRGRNGGRGLQGVLYSAGGAGLLVADTRLDETDLETQVKAWLEANSHGLKFTVVAQRLAAKDLEPTGAPSRLPADSGPLARFDVLDGLAGALVRLQVAVRRRKDERVHRERRESFEERSGQPIERCPSCGRRPPGTTPVEGDDPKFWCPECQALRRYWKANGGATLEREGRPLTFEDLAASSSRGRGYLSFLAVDGNSMGAVLQGVRSLLELRAFSEATTRIYQAARERAVSLLPGYLGEGWSAAEAHLSLLSGGDEITLVLPASAAPAVALEVLQSVEAGFDQATAAGGLLAETFADNAKGLDRLRSAGAGAGLIAAQSSFPVRLLRRYAGELQKEAKRAAAGGDLRSAIGWLLLTDSSPLPEGAAREGRDREMAVASFAERLAEVRAAAKTRLPRSALQRILEQGRREEEGTRTLDPGTARDDVVATLLANFFRYQLARNSSLADWWEEVRPTSEEGAGDAVQRWLRQGGVARLERLTELLSLEPVPRELEGSVEGHP